MKLLTFFRLLFSKAFEMFRRLFGRPVVQELPKSVDLLPKKSLDPLRNLKQVPMSPKDYGIYLANHPHRG